MKWVGDVKERFGRSRAVDHGLEAAPGKVLARTEE